MATPTIGQSQVFQNLPGSATASMPNTLPAPAGVSSTSSIILSAYPDREANPLSRGNWCNHISEYVSSIVNRIWRTLTDVLNWIKDWFRQSDSQFVPPDNLHLVPESTPPVLEPIGWVEESNTNQGPQPNDSVAESNINVEEVPTINFVSNFDPVLPDPSISDLDTEDEKNNESEDRESIDEVRKGFIDLSPFVGSTHYGEESQKFHIEITQYSYYGEQQSVGGSNPDAEHPQIQPSSSESPSAIPTWVSRDTSSWLFETGSSSDSI